VGDLNMANKHLVKLIISSSVLSLFFGLQTTNAQDTKKSEVLDIAVIVNAKHSISELKSSELREILELEDNFWPNGKHVQIMLPPRSSIERMFLIE
jgi:hypothetical protein